MSLDPTTWPTAIYQVYVDAFARGSSGRSRGRRHGGDLEGVLERVDHVADLGADAIWLTPVFASTTDHGYNVTDFFRLDPRLAPDGTAEEADALFAAVLDAAHARGVRVLLDLPLNHVGHDYDLAAIDPHRPPRSRPARTREERGWAGDLKYLDHDDEATREFCFRVATHWVERFGVDGFRYDYVRAIGNAFWEELYRRLTSIRPDLFFVGEHWSDVGTEEENARDIATRFDGAGGPCFDTLFDFPFRAAAVEALRVCDPSHLLSVLGTCDAAYPRPGCAMLDNHDTARLADWVDGDARRVGVGLDLLGSRSGPICLLYGTETGLRSFTEPREAMDVSCRVPLDWASLDAALVARTRAMLAARRESPALVRGRSVARAAFGPLYVDVKEADDGSRAACVLNFSEHTVPAWTDVGRALGGSPSLAPLGGAHPIGVRDGRLTADVPGYRGGLYRL